MIWICAVLLLSVISLWLYFEIRPGISKFGSGLNFLHGYGADGAEIYYKLPRSSKQLSFRLKIVGGVKQVHIVTDRLELSSQQRSKLSEILDQEGLKLETLKSKAKKESVNVGYSKKTACLVATRIAREVMNWNALTRFSYSFNRSFNEIFDKFEHARNR